MNILSSMAEHGLVAIPPLSATPHLHVRDNRLAMTDDADPLRAPTERLVGKDELASIRRELRAMILARAMATVPRWTAVVESLKKQAMAMPLWYLWLLAILAPPTMIGSAIWMIAGTSVVKHVLGSAGLALFGGIAMQAVYGLTCRLQAP
jgi:hypothetical protein